MHASDVSVVVPDPISVAAEGDCVRMAAPREEKVDHPMEIKMHHLFKDELF